MIDIFSLLSTFSLYVNGVGAFAIVKTQPVILET